MELITGTRAPSRRNLSRPWVAHHIADRKAHEIKSQIEATEAARTSVLDRPAEHGVGATDILSPTDSDSMADVNATTVSRSDRKRKRKAPLEACKLIHYEAIYVSHYNGS